MTSSWNYRVLEEPHVLEENYCRIIECHYDDDGNIYGWSEARPIGDNVSDLEDDMLYMQMALTRPVLTLDDLPAGDDEDSA